LVLAGIVESVEGAIVPVFGAVSAVGVAMGLVPFSITSAYAL
jgi:hypothetical protein